MHIKSIQHGDKLFPGDENYASQEKNAKAIFSEMKILREQGKEYEGIHIKIDW